MIKKNKRQSLFYIAENRWDRKKMRAPDVLQQDEKHDYIRAIWYDPDATKPSERDWATEIEMSNEVFLIMEYDYAPDPDAPEEFLVSEAAFATEVIKEVLRSKNIRPRTLIDFVRWAASLTAAFVAYSPDSHFYESELPG